MAIRVPTCVWKMSDELLLALDERFGAPVDAYVNGSQVWLRDDGPGGITVEWRLHPVAGYRRPAGMDTYDVFDEISASLASGAPSTTSPGALWDGLEAFPAYGDEVEPATLAVACTEALGRTPDVAGLADHQTIGDSWERSAGRVSVVDALLDQMGPPPLPPPEVVDGPDN